MAKIAIVTGAAGNLGEAVVRKFIDEGYSVVGTVTPKDDAPLDFPADKFERIAVDLMKEEDAEKFVEAVIAKHGRIDVAVLTVGGFAMGSVADTKTTAIVRQYKLNFETAYNVARPAFIQMLKQKDGRIFLVGSRPGLDAKSGTGMVAYGLAKSLLFRLAELMNAEAKGKNVVTSVIVPSTIDTPVNRQEMPGADFSNWVKPEQIASVIAWHSGEAASALRETVIKVYGNA